MHHTLECHRWSEDSLGAFPQSTPMLGVPLLEWLVFSWAPWLSQAPPMNHTCHKPSLGESLLDRRLCDRPLGNGHLVHTYHHPSLGVSLLE